MLFPWGIDALNWNPITEKIPVCKEQKIGNFINKYLF